MNELNGAGVFFFWPASRSAETDAQGLRSALFPAVVPRAPSASDEGTDVCLLRHWIPIKRAERARESELRRNDLESRLASHRKKEKTPNSKKKLGKKNSNRSQPARRREEKVRRRARRGDGPVLPQERSTEGRGGAPRPGPRALEAAQGGRGQGGERGRRRRRCGCGGSSSCCCC